MGTLNSTPRTWVSGEVVTPAEMNAEIRDALTNLQSAWQAFTPTTTGITLGNGTIVASLERFGKTILFRITFTFGSTSVITGAPTFTLPVTAQSNLWSVDATVLDASAGAFFTGRAVATSQTVVTAKTLPGTAGNALNNMSATAPMTWVAGDILTILGAYEAS